MRFSELPYASGNGKDQHQKCHQHHTQAILLQVMSGVGSVRQNSELSSRAASAVPLKLLRLLSCVMNSLSACSGSSQL